MDTVPDGTNLRGASSHRVVRLEMSNNNDFLQPSSGKRGEALLPASRKTFANSGGETNLKHNLYKHATRNAQIIVAHEETRLNGHAESLSSKDEEGKVEAWECVGMGVNARSLPGVGLPEKSTLPLTPRCHRGLHCHLAHRWQMPLRRLRQK